MPHYICRKTGNKHDLNEPIWQSPEGRLLDISHQPDKQFLDDLNATNFGMWRYKKTIPVKTENILDFGDGFTPLIPISLYGHNLKVKLDFLFSSGSFKDRGAAVLISKVKELGITKVVEDSSGNAGTSISAYCAKAGIDCDIYVSENASPAKLTQIAMYGAKLKKIPGDRKNVTKAVMEAAQKEFYASHYWHPFFFEGTKTYAYELWEQMGRKIPGELLFQIGHGTLLIGAYKGFQELKNNGLIEKIPVMHAVQPANCAPLFDHFYDKPPSEISETIAEGINIEDPPRMKQIKEIIQATNGSVIKVADDDIQQAMRDAAAQGIYTEAASASALAALKQLPSLKDDGYIVPLTGNGLKNTEKFREMLKDHS